VFAHPDDETFRCGGTLALLARCDVRVHVLRKVGIIFKHLRAEGVSEEQLARVHAPIGLDLSGRSPAEIALAIAAEVVQVRYGGRAQRLSLLCAPEEGLQ